MTQTTQPVGQFAQARALYGRSKAMQLLIFVGLQFAGSFLIDSISMLCNVVGTILAQNSSMMDIDDFYMASSYGVLLLSLAVTIGLLFIHRSITFRSADRAACTALPLAGLVLLQALLGGIAAGVLNSTGVMMTVVEWHFSQHTSGVVIAAFAGAWLANILSAVLGVYARAGTVRLARTKGRRALCILPILGLIPLAFVSHLASLGMTYNSGMTSVLFMLISLLLSLLSLTIVSVCGFHAQHKLIYRDTWDTAPAARQHILRCMHEAQTTQALL